MRLGMIGLGRMGPIWCDADYADRLLSAMRYAFGGHEEKKP